MKPGIKFLQFKLPYNTEDSARLIKQAGFKSTMFWWYDNLIQADFTPDMPTLGTKEEQLAILRTYDIEVCYIHAHSEIPINAIWVEGIWGDRLVEEFKKSIQDCSRIHVPIMVMHTASGNSFPSPNEIGLNRVRLLAEHARNHNVIIAIENCSSTEHIDYLLEHISLPSLGFCYDSGHDFLYSKIPYEIIYRHGKRLVAVHLHDNEGGNPKRHPEWHPDNHSIPGEGNIDWNTVKTALDEVGYKGVRLLEVESNTILFSETPEEFLKRAFRALEKYL